MISADMSDQAILEEIGLRISRYRLNKNMTQKQLAQKSGVSLPTIQRAEKGTSVQMLNLVCILRALHLINNIDSLIPGMAASPIQKSLMKGKDRKRASGTETKSDKTDWTWGDDK